MYIGFTKFLICIFVLIYIYFFFFNSYLQTYIDMGTNYKRLEKLTKIYQSNPE